MQPTLFIADLHLSEDRPDITQAFLRFMRQQATKAQALYVLGEPGLGMMTKARLTKRLNKHSGNWLIAVYRYFLSTETGIF